MQNDLALEIFKDITQSPIKIASLHVSETEVIENISQVCICYK